VSVAAGPDTADGPLEPSVRRAAVVVLLGSIMAILDSTIVTVALPRLTDEFRTSFATIQWVTTGYLLALVMAVPLTGWAADRFGAKRLYLAALGLFLVGSMLAGLAWDVPSLILFRVVQGIGGGVLGPAGTTVLVKAAGPRRVSRAVSVLGVPMLLGPISGPILGGWLVDLAGWRWLFYVNVPIGVLAFVLAARFLEQGSPRPGERLDLPGLVLLSPGLALVIFGVSLGATGGDGMVAAVMLAVGLSAVVGFVLRATRIRHALVDLRLFRSRSFAVSAAALSLFVVGFLGSGVLFPAYFLLARGESTLDTGLLLAPSGFGAIITVLVCGRLADRIGPARIVPAGLGVILVGMAAFATVGAATPIWLLELAQFVMGLGMGAAMVPLLSSALGGLAERQVARASTLLTVLQQAFGAIGAAAVSIVLAARLGVGFGVPTAHGQAAATAALVDPRSHDVAAAVVAGAFATAFGVAFVLVALCLVPAFLLRSGGR
jgi:EmrB/QacA subfamily drug resistance transporter